MTTADSGLVCVIDIRQIGSLRHEISNADVWKFADHREVQECTQIVRRQPRKTIKYVVVEYRLKAELEHPLLKWSVYFPRTGSFANSELHDMGKVLLKPAF